MRADPSSVNQELFLNVPSLQTVFGSGEAWAGSVLLGPGTRLG